MWEGRIYVVVHACGSVSPVGGGSQLQTSFIETVRWEKYSQDRVSALLFIQENPTHSASKSIQRVFMLQR